MQITEILYAASQEVWRNWLVENHATKKEIWLVCKRSQTEKGVISYLHAVEEAICFGWIDSTSKKIDAENTAQRFSPRRSKSNWTELNKERARRLIQQGRMTEAGLRALPDLSPEAFHISEDILDALQADVQIWENFQKFPVVYQRIRIGNIESVRKQPEVFQKRLQLFLKKTRENNMYGEVE
ncbi:MAG: thymidylate synthase [Anaerolinea sp.]|nr:thymidylate synthase [Anaerolinea sp.]